ncbi:hypothetical protein BB560_002265 [Smittium megazygosporum]|uniref:Uncharacterized protein n=1 Tax=Smittium megazygosporum TaxID=133381 RepID=A0A2T9ZF81_9FUNG|nr:hypothetical protein BB560_002265 [Smittium megazygosporum]
MSVYRQSTLRFASKNELSSLDTPCIKKSSLLKLSKTSTRLNFDSSVLILHRSHIKGLNTNVSFLNRGDRQKHSLETNCATKLISQRPLHRTFSALKNPDNLYTRSAEDSYSLKKIQDNKQLLSEKPNKTEKKLVKINKFESADEVEEWVVENESNVKDPNSRGKIEETHEIVDTDLKNKTSKSSSIPESSGIAQTQQKSAASELNDAKNPGIKEENDTGSSKSERLLGVDKEEQYMIEYARMALGGTLYPFDTAQANQVLIQAGLDEGKSLAIIESIRSIMIKKLASSMQKQPTADEIEKSYYKIKADLQYLRTEMLMMRKNNQSILLSEFATTSREREGLSQQIKDEISNLRSEILISLNDRKYNRNITFKNLEMLYQENQKKYYAMLEDCRTELESTKLGIIRQALFLIFSTGIVVFFFPLSSKKDQSKNPSPQNQAQEPYYSNSGKGVIEF